MAEGGDSGAPPGTYPPDPAGTRDYRTWVRRLVRLALKLGVYPSREALAEAAGFNGATLSNAMHRRRHVSEEILRRLCAALGLDKPWTSWLVWWMTAQRAPSAALRRLATAEMRAIEPALSPLRPPRPGPDGFRGVYVALPHPLSTWLGRVLYTMAQLPDRDMDPVRSALSLERAATPRAIGDTLRTLRECGALVSGPSGRLLTQEQHLIAAWPASARPGVEAIDRTRQSLLVWADGAQVHARLVFVPTDRLIPWGWEVMRQDEERAIGVESAVGTVRATQPEPGSGLPRAQIVIQSVTMAILLRRAGDPPVEQIPEPPTPLKLPGPPDRSAGPSLFDHTHPEPWIRAALRANRGTSRPSSQRALVEAGVSPARVRYLMHPELGRRLPLDDEDLAVLTRLFRLGAPAQRLLRRMVHLHQARSTGERRALVDELAGLVEAERLRLGEGAQARAATRLEHLLVRGLKARGLKTLESISEVLGWPREQVGVILQDLAVARGAEGEAEPLALPGPRESFGAQRLIDELLQRAARDLEGAPERLFLRVAHSPTHPDHLLGVWAAQRALVDRHAALTTGPGPMVPVVLLTAIHRVVR